MYFGICGVFMSMSLHFVLYDLDVVYLSLLSVASREKKKDIEHMN